MAITCTVQMTMVMLGNDNKRATSLVLNNLLVLVTVTTIMMTERASDSVEGSSDDSHSVMVPLLKLKTNGLQVFYEILHQKTLKVERSYRCNVY